MSAFERLEALGVTDIRPFQGDWSAVAPKGLRCSAVEACGVRVLDFGCVGREFDFAPVWPGCRPAILPGSHSDSVLERDA